MSFVVLEGMPVLLLTAGIVGLALTAGGIALFIKGRRFAAGATRAPGTVVAIESVQGETTDDEGRPAIYIEYHPVLEYKDPGGAQRRVKTKSGSNPAAAAIGDKIVVLIDRNDPEVVDIDSAVQLWVIPGVLLALGVLVLGFVFAGLHAA